MMILGIDPGASGGLAVIDSDLMQIVKGFRMPTQKLGVKTLVDANGIIQALGDVDLDAVMIEHVHSMPGQGHVGAFSFGRSTGAAEAVASLICDRLDWVPPSTWKKHFKLSSDKQLSINLAQSMFGLSYTWKYKADDGIAEASLMARYWIDKFLMN